MKIFDIFRKNKTSANVRPANIADGGFFFGFDDPRFKDWIRGGGTHPVDASKALENTAVFRSISLISYAIAMLPIHVINAQTKEKAVDDSLYQLLHTRPNDWQTSFNFRQYMQRNALIYGNAYAFVVRSMGRAIRLVPLDPANVIVKQNDDWTVEYHYSPPNGATRVLKPEDVLHIYADSKDGITGTSLVSVAAKSINLASEIEAAQLNFFKNGMLLGGLFKIDKTLSPEAYERLKKSINEQYSGSKNAGKWIVGEEGATAQQFTSSAKDSQQLESRRLQIEEIARAFGVPRPLLGLDDTSWGTGIDVLGQMFVRYALNPWFSVWEQAIKRSCMNDEQRKSLDVKFNAGGLLRGSMKDQSEFFAKALGSGGHQPWMDYDEVRDTMDLPKKYIAPNALTQQKGTDQ